MRVAIVRTTAPASTGNWDFTATGFGTCIGASFKISGGLADQSPTNGARLGVGFTDGVSNRGVSWASQNGQVSTICRRRKSTTYCLFLIDPGGAVNGRAAFSSFITDGIRLNCDDAFGNAFFVEARLYFDDGNDETFVGTADTTSGDVDVTAVGFTPSFLEGISTVQSSVDTSQTNAKFLTGFAVNVGSPPDQNSFSFYEATAQADGSPSARVDSSYFLRDMENSSVLGAVQIDNFDSSGFTAKQINSAGFEFYYMAVKCDNQVSLDLAQTPTSAITDEHDDPGFKPLAVFGWNSKIDTLNSNFENDRAGAFGLWQSTSSSNQYNSSIAIEDAAGITNCQSDNDNSFPYLPDDDGGTTTALIGTITQFTSLGFEVSYSTVDSVQCYFSILAIKPVTQTLSPGGIASLEAFGTASLTAGNVNVSPSGIASAETWGTAALSTEIDVLVSAIGSLEAWGTPALEADINVSPSGIASLEAWGTPSLAAEVDILVSAIASLEAWGTPTLTAGGLVLQPSGIASAEAWGTPSLSPGAVSILVSGIASGEAWGTPELQVAGSIVVTGIASGEAWGTPALSPGVATILVSGIASGEAWGTAALSEDGGALEIIVQGIASGEDWGVPYLFGGAVPVTLKKKIHDALCEAVEGGTFLAATYDSENCELEQGLQIVPASIEVNEVSSAFAVEGRHGRKYLQDFTNWHWLVIIRFHQEAICEPWVRAMMEDPLCIHRDAFEDRQVRLLLLDAAYDHPPREGASNGTVAKFRFNAELSAR